jgi:GT2 family glycosyltransferase
METASRELPRVEILILNWNGWRNTIECLESVFQLDHGNFRVTVCDNGSTDDSVERIREWSAGQGEPSIAGSPLAKPARSQARALRLVEYSRAEAERGGDRRLESAELVLIHSGSNLGFAAGNNVGIRLLATCSPDCHVWLLNNDMVVRPNTLSLMQGRLSGDAGIGAVGATLLEYYHPNTVQAAGGGRFVKWQGFPRPHSAAGKARGTKAALHPDRLDFLSMGCVLMPMAVVKQVGLIDERFFMYCEDIDYSLRLVAAGYRLEFASNAEVFHKGSASAVAGSPVHDYNMVKSALLLVRKHNHGALPVAACYSLWRCAAPKVLRGEWVRLAAALRGLRDGVRSGTQDSVGGPAAPRELV